MHRPLPLVSQPIRVPSQPHHLLRPQLLRGSIAIDFPVRISHWLNVPCLLILIMSGLQILNAHPALYWGDRSDHDLSWLSIRPMKTESGEVRGITTILVTGSIPQESSAIRMDLAVPFLLGRPFRATNF
jgi:hypothetical protein